MPRKVLVAVAWPYANGEPHLGHIAGTTIPADIFARYHRCIGNQVAMVSGSDMHGTPTILRSIDENVSPESITNHYHSIWKDCLTKMNFSYDIYTHTHTNNHFEIVQDLFKCLLENGHIYEAVQTLPFSNSEGIFLTDRMVKGKCPHCSYEDARGDQCENCGRTLDPIELIDIRSKRDDSELVFRDTKHLFLKLTNFQKDILEWVNQKTNWRVNVRNQTLRMLKSGLQDRAITRDINWGIPVPVEGYENKRIYVWFEAVLGYLSATVEWAKRIGQPDKWKEFWEDEKAEIYYFQGKDNVPFHTIILPAILIGSKRFNLPTDVVANEFLNLKGKFSKSKGNAVWLKDYLNKYEPEPLRYYLTSIMPENADSEFSWEGFVQANNNELVATYGNFVHRTLSLTYRQFKGTVPKPLELTEEDISMLNACKECLKQCANAIEARYFKVGLRHAMTLAQLGNRYINTTAPWKSQVNNKYKTPTTLWVCLNVCATLSKVFYPFLPESSQNLYELLGLEGNIYDNGWQIPQLQFNKPILQPNPLFKKLDTSIIEEETSVRNS